MRKFLILTVALMLVLGLSGAALAYDNELYLDQDGTYNVALVGQLAGAGVENYAEIDQRGGVVNFTMLVQSGGAGRNYSDIRQDNAEWNVFLGEQIGDEYTIQEKIEWAIDEYEVFFGTELWSLFFE